MQKKRIALILVIALFAIGCFLNINSKYDVLARYPYTEYMSEKDSNLIRNHLNKDEIEYIIEYAIAPADFIRYIEAEGFNIYDISQYNAIGMEFEYIDPFHCVKLIQLLKNHEMSIDNCISYLYAYTSEEMILYLEKGDPVENSFLVFEPGVLSLDLSSNNSVGYYAPHDLIRINSVQTANNQSIFLRMEAAEALADMCAVASVDLQENSCGGLIIKEGYKSWEQIEEDPFIEFAEEGLNRAGHNEHQLGLAIDFELLDEEQNFKDSKQSAWLQEHSAEFGFVASNPDNASHYRFMGKPSKEQDYGQNSTD